MFILKRLPKNIKIKPAKSKPIVRSISPIIPDNSGNLFWLCDILLPDTKLSPKTISSFGPEDRECYDFVMWLRQQSIEGRMPYSWHKICNEFDGKENPLFGHKMSWLGKISGCPDYAFLGKTDSFYIEMKAQTKNYRGKLSSKQETFLRWSSHNGVPHYVCYNSKEAQKVVLDHIEM